MATIAQDRQVYEKLGAHFSEVDGRAGVHFAVWAPDAARVSAIGDFNNWEPEANQLTLNRDAGVWAGFVSDVAPGALYKYRIVSPSGGEVDEADPYGFAAEAPPGTASRVWDLGAYRWNDDGWVARRSERNGLDSPISIYEVDAGSWRRVVEEGNRPLTYRELAVQLADYVHDAGYTHVAFLPLTEPGSLYAPTSRFGSPADCMYLVDYLHQREIGVIFQLDGTYVDAPFWFDRYHVDDLRGFGFTWNAGWTEDILEYMMQDPINRSHYHHQLTSSPTFAFSENFVLPLSHDDVANGKGSLLAKMPGDEWRRFANLRLLFAYQFGHPGKKLLFMGDDFGQWNEWRADASLDWHLTQYPLHAGVERWVRDLNTFYRGQPSLYQLDFEPAGFEWVDAHDYERSVASFLRRARDPEDATLAVFNFTPVPRTNYRVGVPHGGFWRECLNSDACLYGGSGQGNIGGAEAAPLMLDGQPFSLSLTLPPLGALFLRNATDIR